MTDARRRPRPRPPCRTETKRERERERERGKTKKKNSGRTNERIHIVDMLLYEHFAFVFMNVKLLFYTFNIYRSLWPIYHRRCHSCGTWFQCPTKYGILAVLLSWL